MERSKKEIKHIYKIEIVIIHNCRNIYLNIKIRDTTIGQHAKGRYNRLCG